MSNNAHKKTIVFSSLEKKSQLEGMLKDIAITDRCTESFALEVALETALLPSNSDAKRWVEDLYDGGNLAQAFEHCFGYVSMGVNWGVKESNTKELVVFFASLLKAEHYSLQKSSHEIDYLRFQWATIASLIESSDKQFCRNLLDMIERGSTIIEPYEYVSVIVANWEQVYLHTCTFRFLSYIARMMKGVLKDTPVDRVNFCRKLKHTTATW